MTLAEATTILSNTTAKQTAVKRNQSTNRHHHHRQQTTRGLQIAEFDPVADRVALEQIATQCHQFSPLVGFEAPLGSKKPTVETSSLLMDITGSAPRLGGEHALAQRMTDFIRQLGYTSRVAIAHTIGAAWAFAHFAIDSQSGTNFANSNIQVIATEQTTDLLAPLPIAALRLPNSIGDLLSQLGIQRVGDLFQLPRESLHARFGHELLLRMDQATGRMVEAILAHSPAPPLTVTRTLEHPTARRDAIEHLTRDLVNQLCRHLTEQDREAVQIEYRLVLASKTTTDIRVGLYQPTASPQHICGLLQMQLENTFVHSPIQQATLTVMVSVDRTDQQRDLFDTDAPSTSRQLAHLIERLSSRLGTDRVVAALLSGEPQIEFAYQYHALAGHRPHSPKNPKPTPNKTTSNQTTASHTRPLLLIHPPIPLHVADLLHVSGTRQITNVPPATFRYSNETHHMIAYWGPERIETGWWRGSTIRRDYYHVENEYGNRFWIFHDLRQQRWFLHGE